MSPVEVIDSLSPGELRRRDAFLRLARGVGALLHETQRERGVSALHVKSGRRMFAKDLAGQRARTDARSRGAAALVETVGPSLLGDVGGALDRIGEATRAVASVRADIERAVATPEGIVDTFSALNAALLAAIDEGAAQVSGGESRGLALAELALLHAKEKTGLERARVGAALVAGAPDAADVLALAELVAAQASYLHVYGLTAPTAAAQLLKRVLAAPPALEVKRLEARFLASASPLPMAPVDATTWFAAISRKIEMLGDVADATLNYFPAH